MQSCDSDGPDVMHRIGRLKAKEADMKTAFCVLILGFATAAACASEPVALKLKPKTALVAEPTVAPTIAKYAPFAAAASSREEFPEIALRADAESKDVPNSCSSAESHSLCYDYKRGRAVYKPTRNWMPGIPGMRSESITMKRDKVAFNYSFK